MLAISLLFVCMLAEINWDFSGIYIYFRGLPRNARHPNWNFVAFIDYLNLVESNHNLRIEITCFLF